MKTQASIWIDKKKPQPIDIDDFLKTIFFKGDSIQTIATAEIIIRSILDKGFNDSDREKVMDSAKVSQKQYYSILARMKACGLIKKYKDQYIITKDFSNALTKLSNYWEGIYHRQKPVERVKFTQESEELTEEDMESYID